MDVVAVAVSCSISIALATAAAAGSSTGRSGGLGMERRERGRYDEMMVEYGERQVREEIEGEKGEKSSFFLKDVLGIEAAHLSEVAIATCCKAQREVRNELEPSG